MFEHSVRVPRHFKIAANIYKKVSTEGGSVKALLYDDKLRHFRTNVLFALITETIKHAAYIDKLFENCGLLTKESRLDPWLAKVLTAELLFGKKNLPGKSKPEQTILSYRELFEKYANDHQDDLKTKVVRRPRYVRVNTNLLTTSDAIRSFQDEGYRFIRCTSGSYNDYLQQIQLLTEYDFTQDYHVKTVFVFSSGTKLHEHELYLESKIILQDKATAMAVHLLAPPPGSVVLDMCAAPGMKTTQLAAYMRNEGKIYAVERNEKRYQTLCDFVEKTGSTCVETLHKDALEIKRGDHDDVEYILLDPSCSGSGMEFSVHNYIEDTRLAKLTSLQEKFLKHAMNSFPKAKRIVYSTCSLFPEENERVITNVVKTSRAKWRVQEISELLKGQWNNFGSGMYGSMGARCMYAKPDTDFTTGFFLAVLDRDNKEREENEQAKKKKNKNENDIQEFNENESLVQNEVVDTKESQEVNAEVRKKKNKKNKLKNFEENQEVTNTEELPNAIISVQNAETEFSEINKMSKKEKKKKKNREYTDNIESSTMDTQDIVQTDNKTVSKKKKKRKNDNNDNSDRQFIEEIQPNEEPVERIKKKKNKSLILNENEHCHENIETETNEAPKKKKKRDKISI